MSTMRAVLRGPLCALICPSCVHIARWVSLFILLPWFFEFASHGHGAVVADCGLFVVFSSVLASFGVFVVVLHVAFILDRADMLQHHSFAVRLEHGIGWWRRRAGSDVVSYVSAVSARRTAIQVRQHFVNCRFVSCDTFGCDCCGVVRARLCGWIVDRSFS